MAEPDIEQIANAAIAHVREAIRQDVAGAGDPPQRPPLEAAVQDALIAAAQLAGLFGSDELDGKSQEYQDAYTQARIDAVEAVRSLIPLAGRSMFTTVPGAGRQEIAPPQDPGP